MNVSLKPGKVTTTAGMYRLGGARTKIFNDPYKQSINCILSLQVRYKSFQTIFVNFPLIFHHRASTRAKDHHTCLPRLLIEKKVPMFFK